MIRLANSNKRGYFLLALTASFATAYPCAPVFGLLARPNFAFDLHSSGRHYVEAAVWMTLCFSIAVPGILWLAELWRRGSNGISKELYLSWVVLSGSHSENCYTGT